jgi:Right handed beta helix region
MSMSVQRNAAPASIRLKHTFLAIVGVVLLSYSSRPIYAASPTHIARSVRHGRTSGSVVSFVSPVDGQQVSGSIVVTYSFSSAPSTSDPTSVWWTQLSVDGTPVADGYNNVPWNTATASNGTHSLRVDGYAYSSTTSLGSSTISVTVSNSVSPSTPTATPAPSSTPSSIPTPSGTVFYVSPNGSDSAEGSSSAPWRTVQMAARTLQPGQSAVVLAGNYGERVSITRSGTRTAPITLQAATQAGAKLLGFDVSGSNWVLNGFDISTQTNGTDGIGIYVTGSAAYDTLQNNYIHELCHEGIFMDPGVSHITAVNNRVWRAEMAGIEVNGTNDLIEGNEVWGTQQKPVLAGGIYSACVTPGGADADAFRFFGQHNVFQGNYAHDIYTQLPTNPNPHTDCFQTWGSTVMTVDDILIEQNVCRWPSASTAVDAETAMIEGVDGPVGTVTFQNNELSNMRQGIVVGSKVSAMHVYNNTWDHILQQALIFSDLRSPSDEIVNNIFYDVGSGGDSYAAVPNGSPTFDCNDFYMPGGAAVGTYPTIEPYVSVDPMFVNFGDPTGAGADYHLKSASPLKGTGITLPQVTNDFYGVSRPAGAYSIGAAQ